MAATGEAEFAARSVERLSFFSDAVVAIAITLLAIDLPVPSGTTVASFWSSVRQNDGHYVAFLISFLVIATAWSHHHDIFRYATDMDSGLRQVNFAWLLTIVLIPFATRLLTAKAHEALDVQALRFGFYALLQALSSVLLLVMLRHLRAREQALAMPPATAVRLSSQLYVVALAFGLSIPIFFATSYAWLVWILIPVAFARLARNRHASKGQEHR
jgi:uncharacterized membrane protein